MLMQSSPSRKYNDEGMNNHYTERSSSEKRRQRKGFCRWEEEILLKKHERRGILSVLWEKRRQSAYLKAERFKKGDQSLWQLRAQWLYKDLRFKSPNYNSFQTERKNWWHLENIQNMRQNRECNDYENNHKRSCISWSVPKCGGSKAGVHQQNMITYVNPQLDRTILPDTLSWIIWKLFSQLCFIINIK